MNISSKKPISRKKKKLDDHQRTPINGERQTKKLWRRFESGNEKHKIEMMQSFFRWKGKETRKEKMIGNGEVCNYKEAPYKWIGGERVFSGPQKKWIFNANTCCGIELEFYDKILHFKEMQITEDRYMAGVYLVCGKKATATPFCDVKSFFFFWQ